MSNRQKGKKDSSQTNSRKKTENEQIKNFESELQRIQRQKKSIGMYLMIFIISISGSGAFVYNILGFDRTDDFKLFGSTVAFIIGTILIGYMLFTCIQSFFTYNENLLRRQKSDFELECIQNEIEEDIFENSIKMSCRYLDEYYDQTREQAQRGFKISVFVAICGAVLLAIGTVAMFWDHAAPSYITYASGALTEFISAIFFYLYNKTVSSMSNYHDKLVLSQNISIALKVAESLPESEKAEAKKSIINELLKDINVYLVKEDANDEKKKT